MKLEVLAVDIKSYEDFETIMSRVTPAFKKFISGEEVFLEPLLHEGSDEQNIQIRDINVSWVSKSIIFVVAVKNEYDFDKYLFDISPLMSPLLCMSHLSEVKDSVMYVNDVGGKIDLSDIGESKSIYAMEVHKSNVRGLDVPKYFRGISFSIYALNKISGKWVTLATELPTYDEVSKVLKEYSNTPILIDFKIRANVVLEEKDDWVEISNPGSMNLTPEVIIED